MEKVEFPRHEHKDFFYVLERFENCWKPRKKLDCFRNFVILTFTKTCKMHLRTPKFTKTVETFFRIPTFIETIKIFSQIPKFSYENREFFFLQIPKFTKTVETFRRIPKFMKRMEILSRSSMA